MWLKSLLPCFILISCKLSCFAQENWPTPELEQMYHNVQGYQQLKNYKDAIVTLKQLIILVPNRIDLKTQLGSLYYLSADYALGEATLAPIINEKGKTDTTYELLAACQIAQKSIKQAKKTIEEGLELFPRCGLLYYRQGLLFLQQRNNENAAKEAWLSGINKCPAEPLNYLEYAKAALDKGNDVLGLIYGEMYLAMRSDTTGNDLFKQSLYEGWKNYFGQLANIKPTTGKPSLANEINNLFTQLTPVVSDGITTENLTMIRTRFLLEWLKKHNSNSEIQLFAYHDELIRNGWFDIYNEWLFGKAEHEGEYAAWNKFHTDAIAYFKQWRATHLLNTSLVMALPGKD